MSKTKDSQSLSGRARASAISVLEHFMEIKTEVPARIKHFVEYLRNGPEPRGRPKGKLQYDDERYLIEMGRLLEKGEADNPHQAASLLVTQHPELARYIQKNSAIKRLSDAFKKDEALYRFLGRDADPISLKKAAR